MKFETAMKIIKKYDPESYDTFKAYKPEELNITEVNAYAGKE